MAVSACTAPAADDQGKIDLTLAVGGDSQYIREHVIPEFERAQRAKGKDVTVSLVDGMREAVLFNELKAGRGPDVVDIDRLWLGELVEAGLVEPLPDRSWDGREQIPEAVRRAGEYQAKTYALPVRTDGRVLLYNRRLFTKAGLKTDWRPKSWGDIFEAAQALHGVDGVTPIHLRSEMDDLLPLLAGNGGELWRDGAWTGGTPELGGALGLYEQVYRGGLGDRKLHRKSEEEIETLFADGKIGIMFGSKDPGLGRELGHALIPAAEPGAGVGNQDFVSLSSAGLRMINPASPHWAEAYELLTRTISPEAREEADRNGLRRFISEEALPVTRFRPPVPEYDRVAEALRTSLDEIVAGKKSAREATADFQEEVFKIPG